MSLKLILILGLYLIPSVCISADIDLDDRAETMSVGSAETVQAQQVVPADEAFVINPQILPFTYMEGEALYNNYPFSLPADRVLWNTFKFRVPEALPENVMANAGIKQILQERIGQIMCEDGIDIRSLKDLVQRNRGYGFHFFGTPSSDLGGFETVLTEWSKPGKPKCNHIDVALRFPPKQPNDQQSNVLGIVLRVLDLGACSEIETLSLRFMHLDDADLERIHNVLVGKQRKIKRVILSFNDITDAVFAQAGKLTSLIRDVGKLPELVYLDVKGNKIQDPALWDMNGALQRRSQRVATRGKVILGFNGLTQGILDGNKAHTDCLKEVAVYEPFDLGGEADRFKKNFEGRV